MARTSIHKALIRFAYTQILNKPFRRARKSRVSFVKWRTEREHIHNVENRVEYSVTYKNTG